MTTTKNTIGGAKWDAECRRWRGRVLTGVGRHWCYDWDFLPVDETTPEWESCTCSYFWKSVSDGQLAK